MKEKRKKTYIVIILILAFLLLGMLAYIFLAGSDDDKDNYLLDFDGNATEWSGNQQLPGAEKTQGIDIPGFKSLVFIADQRIQKINLYNPETNSCYFKMTLFADDTELWQSKLVKPGDGFYEIVLDKVLQEGTYDAAVRYQCFKEDGTELNSAKMQFKLIVREE